MAKSTKKRIAERPSKEVEEIFLSIPVKEFPSVVQKDHRARKMKIDKLHDSISVIQEQGEKQIKELVRKGVKNG